MKQLPRLVISNDADFGTNPELGLASLLLEAGYTDAELFVNLLKDLLTERSIYKLLKAYAVFVEPSIAACAAMFALLSGDKSDWRTLLTRRAPEYTNGLNNILALVEGATKDNYGQVLTWFGYSDYDYTSIISNPYGFVDWVSINSPSAVESNQAFARADMTMFIIKAVELNTGVDLSLSKSKLSQIKRWVNLSFVQYAFGASIDQRDWY